MSKQQCQQQTTRTEQHGNQVLHVRGDSDSDMEALFSVLRNKSNTVSSSLKNRNLPASFFRPPDAPRPVAPGCSPGGPSYGLSYRGVHDITGLSGLAGGHGRSVSSPAQLAHHSLQKGAASSLSSSSQQQSHIKQGSLDGEMMDEYGNGCGSWDQCPRYYLNNNSSQWQQHQTQQDIPNHGQHTNGPINMYPQQHMHLNSSGHPPHHSSGEFSQDPLSVLPPGWEQGITMDNEIYYINHVDKTTSWFDPRMSARHVQPTRLGQQQQQPPPQQQHHQCQLIHQQQQHQQQPKQQQPNMCNNVQSHHHHHSGRRPIPNEQYLCLELQKVHKEKERLQYEQEAIACREMLLNELVRQSATSPSHDGGSATTMGAKISSHSTAGVLESFLCGQPASMTSLDTHVRQNSTDSGLGGMGAAYSLPRSPEDYLSNVDEIDVEETNRLQQKHPARLCYGGSGSDLHHSGGHHRMDVVTELGDSKMMDTNDLVSSLGEDITNVLLNELDVQKINSMLWL